MCLVDTDACKAAARLLHKTSRIPVKGSWALIWSLHCLVCMGSSYQCSHWGTWILASVKRNKDMAELFAVLSPGTHVCLNDREKNVLGSLCWEAWFVAQVLGVYITEHRSRLVLYLVSHLCIGMNCAEFNKRCPFCSCTKHILSLWTHIAESGKGCALAHFTSQSSFPLHSGLYTDSLCHSFNPPFTVPSVSGM